MLSYYPFPTMGLLSFLNPVLEPIIGGVTDLAGDILGSGVGDLYQNLDNVLNKGSREFAMYQQHDQQAFNAEQSQIQRDWQAEQNSIMNDFNASEAQKARDFTERMNDPAVQLRKQLAAGINPLASDMGAGSVSASPQASASGIGGGAEAQSGVASVAPGRSPLSSTLDILNTLSDIKLKNAEARDKDSDSDLKKSQRVTEDLLRYGRYVEQGFSIYGIKLSNDVKEEEVLRLGQEAHNLAIVGQNLRKQGEKLDAEIEKLREDTGLSRVEKKRQEKELEYFDEDKFYERLLQKQNLKEGKWRIKLMGSEISLNHAKTWHEDAQEEESRQNAKLLGQKINAFILDNAQKALPFTVEVEDENGKMVPLAMELVRSEGQYQLNVNEVEGNIPLMCFDKAFSYVMDVLDVFVALKSLSISSRNSKRRVSSNRTRTNGNGKVVFNESVINSYE